ncbi:MAG TPA: acetyl-CoA carboxylase biotin carboxylase subunit [Massilibacterium sp.]|nr:acetyl-CoA carboxylase biotin carboxylase subunit [Massilibacterium sp.]
MMKKVLIANRGEIAVRIIRACKELGVKSVAIYSDADKDSLHVRLADEAYCVGPRLSSESYLKKEAVLEVAKRSGADGIHPGYGFLAENAEFAKMCEENDIKFIGPSSDAITQMGIKDIAKETVQKAGVPTVPGSDGLVKSVEDAIEVANEIGYPVIIKATAGGGGKGIRICNNEEELVKGMNITQKEAAAAFGNPDVYLEKCITDFRHVEIQILADGHGNVIHLGERDCTIQRRMQKLVEEAPSPVLTEETRQKMGQAAVNAAKACNYTGAGTIEFIYDNSAPGTFYFMEMNTRIQVEHPVTEQVTGLDLVKWQIRIASGEELTIKQEDVQLKGHSIECRINAENPYKNFMPSPGNINTYLAPGGIGVRVDSACYQDYSIPPFYDSMVAKLITFGDTREEAIARMRRALEEFEIEGVHTTIPFHSRLFNHDVFVGGEFNTKFLEIYNVMDDEEK